MSATAAPREQDVGFEGRGHELFIFSLLFTSAAACFVMVRMYVRIALRAVGKDDIAILASLVRSPFRRCRQEISARPPLILNPSLVSCNGGLTVLRTYVVILLRYGWCEMCLLVLRLPFLSAQADSIQAVYYVYGKASILLTKTNRTKALQVVSIVGA